MTESKFMKKLSALCLILLGLIAASGSALADTGNKQQSAKSSIPSQEGKKVPEKVQVKVVPREQKTLSEILKERRLINSNIPVFAIQDKQAMQLPLQKTIEVDFEDLHKYL